MTLFIGGPLDGTERRVQEDRNDYTVRCCEGLPKLYTMADAYEGQVRPTVTTQRYLRHRLGDAEFFAHGSLTVTDALNILLAAYPRKR